MLASIHGQLHACTYICHVVRAYSVRTCICTVGNQSTKLAIERMQVGRKLIGNNYNVIIHVQHVTHSTKKTINHGLYNNKNDKTLYYD